MNRALDGTIEQYYVTLGLDRNSLVGDGSSPSRKMDIAQSPLFTVGQRSLVFNVVPENFRRGAEDRNKLLDQSLPLGLAPDLRTELVPETRKWACFEIGFACELDKKC